MWHWFTCKNFSLFLFVIILILKVKVDEYGISWSDDWQGNTEVLKTEA
jgi:hypothetical protein